MITALSSSPPAAAVAVAAVAVVAVVAVAAAVAQPGFVHSVTHARTYIERGESKPEGRAVELRVLLYGPSSCQLFFKT